MTSPVIEVVPHNPDWARQFQEEAERLSRALGEEVVSIHHIGSTAIPGIKAKPTIDLMIEVPSIDRVDGLNSVMEKLGYQAKGEFGIPGRRFFLREVGTSRTHHVHFFETGHIEIKRHILFRDYLIAHPDEALAYSQLKETLAARFREDRNSYTEAKTDFIQDIDRKATEWNLSRSS